MMRRQLRQASIVVTEPVFIFLGGGIRERVYETLDEEHIHSGFIPRFLVVSGESDLSTLRPTGPPMGVSQTERGRLVEHLRDMHESYNQTTEFIVAGNTISTPAIVNAELTPDAWEKYRAIEQTMVKAANDSQKRLLALPVFERMSRSLLKIATLLGASRQTPQEFGVTIEKSDVLKAAALIQDWGRYMIDLVENCGTARSERSLRRINQIIDAQPGIFRSTITRRFHLSKREADDIITTLEDRGLITVHKNGRGHTLWPT